VPQLRQNKGRVDTRLIPRPMTMTFSIVGFKNLWYCVQVVKTHLSLNPASSLVLAVSICVVVNPTSSPVFLVSIYVVVG
jgi:hypothetical protein